MKPDTTEIARRDTGGVDKDGDIDCGSLGKKLIDFFKEINLSTITESPFLRSSSWKVRVCGCNPDMIVILLPALMILLRMNEKIH